MMSCAAYLREVMLMSNVSFCTQMCQTVRARTMAGHSKYHQNLAAGQYPPSASRLESLRDTGTCGIRYVIEQDLGVS